MSFVVLVIPVDSHVINHCCIWNKHFHIYLSLKYLFNFECSNTNLDSGASNLKIFTSLITWPSKLTQFLLMSTGLLVPLLPRGIMLSVCLVTFQTKILVSCCVLLAQDPKPFGFYNYKNFNFVQNFLFIGVRDDFGFL